MHRARTPETCDVAVVGGGPAGSATAYRLARRGARVLLIERESFPRYHVGESLTGTAGDFVRELGLEAEMERLDFPTKPGVKVVGHDAKNEFYVPVLRPTWQVRRAEFDALLLDRARTQGVVHRRGSVKRVIEERGRVTGLVYTEPGEDSTPREVRARVLVDASGQSAFLSGQGVAGLRSVDAFGRQIAIYSQYEGVCRDGGERRDATVIFYDEPLHWAWLIPVSATTTSIGVVLPIETFKRYGDSPAAVLRWGLDNLSPDLTRRMRSARRTEEVHVTRNYSYRIDPFVGPGWMCIGDAHRFTDPIFSFGVSFALTASQEAAEAIGVALEGGDESGAFARYAELCTRGHDTASDLIHYFWRFPAFFSYLTRSDLGDDVIRLLAGDCFEDPPLRASETMRRTLRTVPGLPLAGAA